MPTEDSLGLLGTTVVEKYAIESVVGEGGFAIVYRAMHLIWKRPVAIKVFKALDDVAPEHRERMMEGFIQEGTLLAELSEKTAAICQARDIGMLKLPKGTEVPFMVLEWLEGQSLEEVLAAEKARGAAVRTIVEAVHLIEPAAEALSLAHEKGIAHRDVKPANIFVLGDPRSDRATVKLLDFGIAKVVQDAQKMAGSFTKTAGVATSFTPAYGAPEQFSRTFGATGPWTDVFAFALVLSEMVSGRDPIEGDNIAQLAFCSMNEGMRPTPRTLGAVVPDAVEAVFVKALAVNLNNRYPSAGEFWNALRVALGMSPWNRSSALPSTPRAEVGTITGIGNAATLALGTNTNPSGVLNTSSTGQPISGPVSGERKGAPKALFLIAGAGLLLGGIGVVVAFGRTPKMTTVTAPPVTLPTASAIPAMVAIAEPAPGECPAGMLPIPGGSFFMGNEEGFPNEKPAHKVTLKPYCMDRLEVSTDQYKTCTDRGGCLRASKINESMSINERERDTYDSLCTIRHLNTHGSHPINCVDWSMAQTYCKEQGGRLPSEAEWEFAALGPDGRKYPWGDEAPTGGHLNACGVECVLWGKKNKVKGLEAMYEADDGHPTTAPVGSFPAGKSRYGVEDVVGNVWEWVGDWSAPYAKQEAGKSVESPSGPEKGDARVIRGGAWNSSDAAWLRPSFRYSAPPAEKSYGVGFRCAKSR